MDSRLYWIWLQQALPAGSRAAGTLLDAFGHAQAIYEADDGQLSSAEIDKALRRRLSDKSLDKARRILDRVLEAGDWLLTPEDALYPLGLRQLPDCPLVLYARGTLPDLDRIPAIALVGTRHATRDGYREAYSLAAGLAAGGAAVVSGGAVGIDAAAHTGALDAGGITVVVMACPVNENYPRDNEELRRRVVAQGGVLMSEFPHGEPYKCEFPIRNRILAGLSQGVCLGETPVRSGARITARLAREQGRDVYALPGALSGRRNDGAHREIQHGAALVVRAEDILSDYLSLFPDVLDPEAAESMQKQMGARPASSDVNKNKPKEKRYNKKLPKNPESVPDPAVVGTPPMATCPDCASAEAKRVYERLTAQPQPVDILAQVTEMPIPVLLAALTELEMFGCVENSAGQQYKRC